MIDQRDETARVDNRVDRSQVTDLSGANLESTSLCRASLANAIIRGANLRASKLQGANLRKAILFKTDLKGANLARSNLGMADLRLACLEQANLRLANLNRANLMGAKLAGACLDQADLAGAILPDGTLFSDETNLSRFTDSSNPEFLPTLAKVEEMNVRDDAEDMREGASAGYRRLPWKQFVEQTYGSLADDPLDLHSSVLDENAGSRE